MKLVVIGFIWGNVHQGNLGQFIIPQITTQMAKLERCDKGFLSQHLKWFIQKGTTSSYVSGTRFILIFLSSSSFSAFTLLFGRVNS